MNSIRGVLIDLSGTLHVGDKACEGAVSGLKKLRQAAIPFRFCTNTTKESCSTLLRKLSKMGFEVHRNEFFTSLTASRNLILSRGLRPLLFLEDDALEDFQGVSTEEPNDAIVIGLSPTNFHYEMLNKAFRILINNNNASLIAVHKGKYYAEQDGLSLGPGAFVEALEYSSGIKAAVVGKPEKIIYEQAIEDMGLKEETKRVVMIGDDIMQDLGAGTKELGMIRYLVKTGKYRNGDESLDSTIDGVFENFEKAVDKIVGGNIS
ncbi:6563_t:CDS:2 [Acaulospora morrowiae]|uniref:Haloacid dehalogenase-like hydrolase domain-containing protein 2 n=1 Tax=Acaulospora morrowiae TaxID=94023 RepID=A0A9N8ZIT2_9GLOM|nr:6563_t:CDS:2 [Acaulospora morrowiae]